MSPFPKKLIIFFSIAFLFFMLSMLVLTYFYKKDAEHFKSEFILVSAEKDKILDSLHVLKATYQIAIANNALLSEQLEAEKRNVEQLMLEIRNAPEVSPDQFSAFRARFQILKNTLDLKTKEMEGLKNQNNQLLATIKDQNNKMLQQEVLKDTLIRQKEDLVVKVKKAENVVLKNFKLVAIKQKKSDQAILTDKANKTDRLVVSFLVQGNALARAGTKSYFVQIIDQNNTILGERESVLLSDQNKLVYSFSMDVNYGNKDVNAFGFLDPYDRRFLKGTYFLKIFDNQDLIGSSSLTLY